VLFVGVLASEDLALFALLLSSSHIGHLLGSIDLSGIIGDLHALLYTGLGDK